MNYQEYVANLIGVKTVQEQMQMLDQLDPDVTTLVLEMNLVLKHRYSFLSNEIIHDIQATHIQMALVIQHILLDKLKAHLEPSEN